MNDEGMQTVIVLVDRDDGFLEIDHPPKTYASRWSDNEDQADLI